MKLDLTLASLFSDLFINLSAGWFGAVLILPATTKLLKKVNWLIMFGNIIFAILTLLVAYYFRLLTKI
ncbi:hypothetical protein A2767_07795 [Candidatus Roizmanbacteria bacterium RIFCSPHIGHO2_01_FULL_35_10]|nr:MAG: hypothetical protein A2767_07795 [Candidatus Roizmanbacteria bacterium RIFCSPHIGHO2_01_FULL_35_10]